MNFRNRKIIDYVLAVSAGILLALSSPGFDIWPAAFGAFGLMAYIYDRKNIKYIYATGISGFVWHIIAASWVSVPAIVFANAPVPAGYAIALGTALAAGIICWMPYGLSLQKTNSHILASLVFIAIEMIKGRIIFGGIPWLNVAQTQHNNFFALQAVSIIGEHGLSLLVIVAGIYAYKAVRFRIKKEIVTAVCLFAGIYIIGILGYNQPLVYGDKYKARIVQTGVDQKSKWNPDTLYERIIDLNSDIHKAAFSEGEYDFLLLPETTYPVNPLTTPQIMQQLELFSYKTPVFIGYDMLIVDNGERKYFNTMGLIKNGRQTEIYRKMKLAPFGEYFPLEKILYPIRNYFFGNFPLFSPGEKHMVFRIDKMRISPLICYESIFSDLWRKRVDIGANVFILISNDAWFGDSIGRVQHLAIDRIHAVEYGRYMLRSTQDGISGLVDPHGRENMFPEKQYYFSDVEFSIIESKTIFAKVGYIWYVLILMYVALKIMRKRKAGK